MDTFALKNIDELFCTPRQSLGVAKRDHVKDPAGFNSGVFVFSPNKKDYDGLIHQIRIKNDLVWKNGEQSLLNERFAKRLNCLSTGYNCGGFLTLNSAKSIKCSIIGDTDDEVWRNRQIVHTKFSDRRYRSSIPTIARKWESYLPK